MSKRKHHYVPRLYLQAFRSAPKQLHIYNLARGLAVSNASLKLTLRDWNEKSVESPV